MLIPQIPSSSLPAFHARYGALLKASMAPQMRKRDKKKEKQKAEAVAKKRKELYVDVDLGSGVGTKGKRGAGRRQRVSPFHSIRKGTVVCLWQSWSLNGLAGRREIRREIELELMRIAKKS